MMDALMLRSLPVKQPEQLMLFGPGQMSGMMDGFPHDSATTVLPAFPRNRAPQERCFLRCCSGGEHDGERARTIFGCERRIGSVHIRLVCGNYFTLLGVGPAAGRVLAEDDDRKPGGNPVAVMSYRFWERRFSRDGAVVGRPVTFNGTAFTIIGVGAREFSGTVVDESPDLWIPLRCRRKSSPGSITRGTG